MRETVTAAPVSLPRLCIGCGRPLEGKRPQAKAHDPACRQRAYRRRKKAARETAVAFAERRSSEKRPLRLVDSPTR